MSAFRLTMHRASEGDALTLTWGEERNLSHALIDLGRASDYTGLLPKLKKNGRFELSRSATLTPTT
jgi:hypothetical protein